MEKEKELWGRRFKIVKNGLDEDEVVAFIESLKAPEKDISDKLEDLDSLLINLTEQHNDLLNRLGPLESFADLAKTNDISIDSQKLEKLDSLITNLTERFQDVENVEGSSGIEIDDEKFKHLDSLIKLAENTIVEAEKQAESIRIELEEKAKENAANIVAEAEERARTEEERMTSEAKEKAQSEAERIIAEAEERAEQIKSSAEEESQNIISEAKSKAEEDAKIIRQEAEQLLTQSKQVVEGEIRGMFDQAYQKLLYNFQGTGQETPDPEAAQRDDYRMDESEIAVDRQGELVNDHNDLLDETLEVTSISEEQQEQETVCEAEQESISYENGKAEGQEAKKKPHEFSRIYEGTIELAIPPPVGLDQVMQLHKDLKKIPNIEVMNFGGSVDKGITIRLVSHDPAPMLDILEDMSVVKKAQDEAQVPDRQVPGRRPGDGPPIRRIILTTK